MSILTRAFWDYAGDRALKSFAQTVIVLAGAQVPPIDVLHTNWLTILAAALAMALVSVCTSVVGYSIPPQRVNPVAPPAAQPSCSRPACARG